jgi:hypothetical protein
MYLRNLLYLEDRSSHVLDKSTTYVTRHPPRMFTLRMLSMLTDVTAVARKYDHAEKEMGEWEAKEIR